MMQKKVLGTGMKRRITGRSYIRTSMSTALIVLLLAGLSSIKVITSCVISPSESVAIVGDRSSFSCNARPNNRQKGSIQSIKLGHDGASGTDIFRPPTYGPGGRIINNQSLADGYFLLHLDENHSIAIIQINETQLKHGGQYFCTCIESTSTLGTANFTVLDKLSFVRSGDEVLTPGSMVELNCSVSFNGSTSSAFIDLTINDVNGTQVSSKINLSLTKNVTGHHVIHYKVVADTKEEQRFTCEVKVWNISSSEGNPLYSKSTNLSLKMDHLQVTTSAHREFSLKATLKDSTAPEPKRTGRTAFIVVGVIATLLLVAVVVVVVFICMKCRARSKANRIVIAQSVGQRSPTANQDTRYKEVNRSIQHPPYVKPQNSEAKKPRNETMTVGNDVFVVENDIYEASSGINPDDGRKTEQIYDQVL